MNNIEFVETQIVLNEQLIKLPHVTKKALLLKHYYGYSYNEVSNLLKVSVDSVKNSFVPWEKK